MMMNAVAIDIRCSTRAIRHLRQIFQATGRAEDQPGIGRPRVTTRGQDHCIWNSHMHNRFQTVTATAANTHGIHNNRMST